jgi:cyclohexyl-isocyanide hydratase
VALSHADICDFITFKNSNFMNIAMLLFDGVTQLDFTAPYEVFSRMPDTKVYIVAEKDAPIHCDCGMRVLPDATFDTPPQYIDLIFIPGGPGVSDAIESAALMHYLKIQAQTAQYITSVCTGALVLAAAGLLRGYKATTHWLSMDLLRLFPEVEVVEERVVIDRNRMTGGGVTAGLDFALTLAAHLHGQKHAEGTQLMLEYDPNPPFNCGSPRTTPPSVIEGIKAERAPVMQRRQKQIEALLRKN